MNRNNITIADVADALGVSKTTVSRAISGKGRISAGTRQKVLTYIKEHDYIPNLMAKGLAQSKTFNLCVVMPKDYIFVELPFFQGVIAGIQEAAAGHEYDILLCSCGEDDVSGLERIIRNRKVDGVVLLRTMTKDCQIEFLLEQAVPFVTVGSTLYPNVFQVDHDHESACRTLTGVLLERGMKKIALLGGNESYVVTQNRYQGFTQAYAQSKTQADEPLVFMNLESHTMMDHALHEALRKSADCILCMDDAICIQVLRKLRADHIRVPKEVRVASFYNSSILENYQPAITSLSFDAREVGIKACQNLLAQIEGEEVPEKTLLSYEVEIRESTEF